MAEKENEQLGGLTGAVAGALAGASLGTAVLPVVGTFVGALGGGILGTQFGRTVGSAILDSLDTSAASTPAAPESDDMLGQLERLGKLHEQGILSDAEFAAAKAKILGL